MNKELTGLSMRAAYQKMAELRKAFNPNQPRDEEGQWTSSGGPTGKETPQQFVDRVFSELGTNPINPRQAVFQTEDGVALLEMEEFNGRVHINWIQAHPQGKGVGSELLRELTAEADTAGVTLDLFLWDQGGRKKDLKRLYQRFGFKPSRQDPDLMIRQPSIEKFDLDQPRDALGRFRAVAGGAIDVQRSQQLQEASEALALLAGRASQGGGLTDDEKEELGRLAAQVATLSKAFDPNQPRDEEGKWTVAGTTLTRAPKERDELPSHIQRLRIPPAWQDVHFNEDPKGDLLVVGRDAKGRLQYVYSERYAKKQAHAKFERIREMEKKYRAIAKENLRNETSSDPRTAEHAQVTSVIMATGIRPGSTADTRAEKQAYGATTLEGRHVRVDGREVTLRFTGKSGVELTIPIADRHIAGILRRRSQSAGRNGRLFPSVSQGTLSDYVSSLDGGGFKTKDFRTALGTMTAKDLIGSMPKPGSPSAYKRAVRAIGRAVSARLGNTPTVALQSYIDPTVFGGWRQAAGV